MSSAANRPVWRDLHPQSRLTNTIDGAFPLSLLLPTHCTPCWPLSSSRSSITCYLSSAGFHPPPLPPQYSHEPCIDHRMARCRGPPCHQIEQNCILNYVVNCSAWHLAKCSHVVMPSALTYRTPFLNPITCVNLCIYCVFYFIEVLFTCLRIHLTPISQLIHLLESSTLNITSQHASDSSDYPITDTSRPSGHSHHLHRGRPFETKYRRPYRGPHYGHA